MWVKGRGSYKAPLPSPFPSPSLSLPLVVPLIDSTFRIRVVWELVEGLVELVEFIETCRGLSKVKYSSWSTLEKANALPIQETSINKAS